MNRVWLLEPRGSDPVAYANYEDAEAAFLKDCGVKTFDELEADLQEWDVWYEFEPGSYLSIDDGTHLREIDFK